MTLEMMKELFGVTHIGEEEVSLSQPIIVAVLLEEEEAPVPQGSIIVVPPEEEEVPVL
jgi:hypothetical protein